MITVSSFKLQGKRKGDLREYNNSVLIIFRHLIQCINMMLHVQTKQIQNKTDRQTSKQARNKEMNEGVSE
jgi:hypothetical protein